MAWDWWLDVDVGPSAVRTGLFVRSSVFEWSTWSQQNVNPAKTITSVKNLVQLWEKNATMIALLTLSALPQISKPPTSSVLLLSFVSFVSTLPSSANPLFLLVHCLCNDAETTGRLSAGSPTTSTLQNSPSCESGVWILWIKKWNKKKLPSFASWSSSRRLPSLDPAWLSRSSVTGRRLSSSCAPWYLSGIYCIIAFETAMRQQNFAKQKLNRKR